MVGDREEVDQENTELEEASVDALRAALDLD